MRCFTLTFRVTLAAVLVLGAVTIRAQAPTPNVRQEIMKVEDALLQSDRDRDGAAWTRVSGEAWMLIGADGQVTTFDQRQQQNKTQAPAGPAPAPAAPAPYYKRPGYTMYALGETAVVTTWNNPPSANQPGGTIQTRVWVKHDGRWQQVLGQVTPITKR